MAVGLVAQTFAFFRQLLSTAYGANAKTPASDAPGTTLDPLFGALAILAVQQQQFLALPIDAASRLASSSGVDVDSFCAPFDITRAPGAFAGGLVTFTLSSPAPGGGVPIPLGLIVQTVGGLQYLLVADAAGNAVTPIVPAGQRTVQGTVQSLTGGLFAAQGSLGNTPANTVTQLFAGIAGIPYVAGIGSITNPSAFTNGSDGESDDEFKARFTLAMSNSKWATFTAVLAAALGVQSGLTVSIGDHIDPGGAYHAAFFSVIVAIKNSAVAPSPTLLTSVATAAGNVCPIGIEFRIAAPAQIVPTVVGNLAVRAGYDKPTVAAAVDAAVQAAINATGLDPLGGSTTLPYASVLATMIADTRVNPAGTTLSINGGTSDLVAPFGSMIVCPTAPAFTTS